VPWCPACDRFLSPPTVTAEGTCPDCGRPVEAGRARPPDGATDAPLGRPGTAGSDGSPATEEEMGPVPFHLKMLGGAMVVYLGYRFLQGVEWVVSKF
jgi:hypothetical protein